MYEIRSDVTSCGGIRDFRTRPAEAGKTIGGEPQSLLTASRKPLALMIPVDSDSLDETLEAVKIGRAQTALRALRNEAAAKGMDKLSPAEVDTIIAETGTGALCTSTRLG